MMPWVCVIIILLLAFIFVVPFWGSLWQTPYYEVTWREHAFFACLTLLILVGFYVANEKMGEEGRRFMSGLPTQAECEQLESGEWKR